VMWTPPPTSTTKACRGIGKVRDEATDVQLPAKADAELPITQCAATGLIGDHYQRSSGEPVPAKNSA